ncbi:hypothetical protein ABZP36_015850 [Zizania latifolia]
MIGWHDEHQVARRSLSASIDGIESGGGDGEEFFRGIQELAVGLHPGATGYGWPAREERSTSKVGFSVSLQILKRRKQQQRHLWGRWDKKLIECAGESERGAVERAFSSMVLIIQEL